MSRVSRAGDDRIDQRAAKSPDSATSAAFAIF